MGDILRQPVVIYVAIVLATVLLLVEIALPTFGVSGTAAVVFGAAAVYGIATTQGAATWWPLLAVMAGIVVWVLVLALRKRSLAGQVVAAVLFAAGSLGYTIPSGSVAAVVAAVIGSVGVPFVFPRLQRATESLMARPPAVGMEATVGRRARVVSWTGTSGKVMLDGAYWDAASAGADTAISPDDTVVVQWFEGMRLYVAPRRATPAGPELKGNGE